MDKDSTPVNDNAKPTLFPDWKFEILKAKELGLLPSDCVCHISCISCGPDRIAYGSNNLSTVYFSEISTPNPHSVKLEFKTDDKFLNIEWLPVEPYHLLVTLEKSLIIIDTINDSVLCQTSSIDPSINFIDAHWTQNGNVISLSHKNVIMFYDNELKEPHQLNDKDYRKRNEGETSFCFAIDGSKLYVGQHRNVLIFDISVEGEMVLNNSFVAHPRDIKKILILNNNLVTLSDKNAVMWDKRDLVPLVAVSYPKNASNPEKKYFFTSDPTGTLAFDSEKHLFKLIRGKKSEIMKDLQLNLTEPIVAAAWQLDENENEKYLHIGSYSQKEFCLALVIKFTH